MARTQQEQANAELVKRFFDEVLAPMEADLVDRYVSPGYIQHSQLAEPGIEALKAFLRRVRRETPEARQTLHRLVAEGDLVVTHEHVVRWPGDPGLAAIDIFRCADGKIVEHWDVIQAVPAEPINPNSMF